MTCASLRGPRREEAQPHGRRLRHGQLRDREGEGLLRRRGRGRRPDRHRREDRLHGRGAAPAGPPSHEATDRASGTRTPNWPLCGSGSWSPCCSPRPSSCCPWSRRSSSTTGVALADAGLAGRRLGRPALPPGRVDQRAARRGHHGHPGLGRHARRVRLVPVGALLRRRRQARHAGDGRDGDTESFSFTASRTGGTSEIYLEVAAGVVAFLLLGRYLEARAKRRSGAALRALMELGAKDVSVLRGGREVRVPIGELTVGRPVRRTARGEGRHRRHGRRGRLGRRRVDADRRVGAGRRERRATP